ncbi:hypothetical protein G6F50_015469 [Rhizopus delemar]|uniref:Uncharacterized protein n=1 Tax=Rhizopus delemar TaxID=936053 RepID=A0A9P6XYQ1_9FUNG|nr:hypothetical protein G6F50_015469 [Rhizopus delemar]
MVHEISGPTLQPKAQRDLRIQVGGGDADARGAGGQRAFGLADVGAAAQQRGAIAYGNGVGQARRRGALQQRRRDFIRRLARQCRQAVQRGALLRLERRQVGLQLFQLAARAGDVQRGAAAGALQAADGVQRFLLHLYRVLGRRQLHAGGAHVGAAWAACASPLAASMARRIWPNRSR